MPKTPIKISDDAGQIKLHQLVHSITQAIAKGQLNVGNPLPSVNRLSSETGFSRDTVFKAYKILKQRNIIESAPQKGYFVAGESYRVFMLLDDFSAFKEQLYRAFRQNLPGSFSVDLLFHHYNHEVFNQLVENSLGRYSAYIVMNINNKGADPVLSKIDPNKLLILDMGKPENGKQSYLLQDFNNSVQQCLDTGKELVEKYSELIMVYSQGETPHPAETVSAVKAFCKKQGIVFRKAASPVVNEIIKGQAYFVIRDSDLVEIIKSCRLKNLVIGKDVGIISYNDTPMKQIVGGGITVISTDFEEMGKLAAGFVKTKQKIETVLETKLIIRESL